MKKYIKKLIILCCTLVMLIITGCTSQEYTLQINDDNTCNLTCQITVSREVYSLLATYDIDTAALNRQKEVTYDNELDDVDALFQEIAVIYNSYGFKITPINDSTIIGFKANKTYTALEEANKEIKNLKQAGLTGFDFEIKHTQTKIKNEYQIYGTLDYILDPDIDMDDTLIHDNFLSLFDTSTLSAKATIVTPMSTPNIKTDGKNNNIGYEWTATYDENETAPVHIISSKTNTYYYYIGFVIGVILLAAFGLIISRIIKKKTSRRNEDFYSNDTYEVDEEYENE